MGLEVDVVTPSFEYGRYILDARHSLRLQRGWAGKHIVMDGGSKDSTIGLLSNDEDPRLLWESAPDRGQSHALNLALAKTNSEWVAWLNADEFYLPNALDRMSQALLRQRDPVDVIFGDCALVDAQGRFLRLLPGHRFMKRSLRWYGCYISSCAVLVRRSLLLSEGWSEDYVRAMDWHLWLRLLDKGARFRYVPEVVACFRIHGAQVTAVPPSSHQTEIDRLRRLRGLPSEGRLRTAPLESIGRAQHIVMKGVDRGYLRQMRARGLRGSDLRWWVDSGSSLAASKLASI
jgi:GT2 family glycosyltransferase